MTTIPETTVTASRALLLFAELAFIAMTTCGGNHPTLAQEAQARNSRNECDHGMMTDYLETYPRSLKGCFLRISEEQRQAKPAWRAS
jgi:hypothetical protein